MKKCHYLILTLLVSFILSASSQDISVYQFRKVADDKISEFLHRETNYWSKVAQKAIDDGKLKQWILLQKIGGYDLPNTSNFLFINTFEDINVNMGEVWNLANVFPDMPMSQVETNSISTVTSMAFVQPMNWEEAEGTKAEDDYNFVKMNFWNTTDPTEFLSLEAEHWFPFIKQQMMHDECNQMAWGNASIINPRGPNVPGNTISFDIYRTLKDVLLPTFPEGTVFPEEGLAKLADLVTGRTEILYQVVMAVTSED